MSEIHKQTNDEERPQKAWIEVAGIAPNLMQGVDAQDFVNELRDEWAERTEDIDRSRNAQSIVSLGSCDG